MARAKALSPLAHVAAHRPPTLVLHGLLDKVVPAEQSKRFVDAMRAADNRCELMLLPNAKHAFVCTRYTAPNETVVEAISAGDRFLRALGFLAGEPTLRP